MYFLLIMFFLRNKRIALKYSLLWIAYGCVFAVMITFPQFLELFTELIGIELPINGLFAGCIFFILIILMSITSIVSKQNEKIKTLTQNNAILEKRVRELEREEEVK